MTLPTSENALLFLHKPRCSKSRETLGLLEERSVVFETRLYLEDPLAKDELADLGRRLNKSPIEFTRIKQTEFFEAGLDTSSSDDQILAAMAISPILLERPILVRGDRAMIGRPPADVLLLLEG